MQAFDERRHGEADLATATVQIARFWSGPVAVERHAAVVLVENDPIFVNVAQTVSWRQYVT